ncbi:MAG: purine-nucleoside phosphorylase [Clostridia bacterium]|nr:purine-nucleoside phosphorylase [Clostridia bacterium]MDN5324082.1 purine-nucleoside phosphorylase [Clostridia bacterium]
MKVTLEYIQKQIKIKPKIGLILGSGLGVLAEEITDPLFLPYKDIPNFPESTVEGHAGQLVIGKLADVPVLTMQGRFHYYEGYNLQKITFPIRVMQGLGIKFLIVTNAAGGINLSFSEGTIMLINDHINLMGTNPLIGKNLAEFGPRFPDMTEAYSSKLISLAKNVAKKLNIEIREGIYAAVTGPSYETPAEIKYLRTIGADAVGMSTVPEVIVANHGSMSVLGISCITNMAAGVTGKKLTHDEVMETAEKVRENLRSLLLGIIKEIGVGNENAGI